MFSKFSKMVMASFLAIGISALSFPVYAAEQPIQIKIGSPAPEIVLKKNPTANTRSLFIRNTNLVLSVQKCRVCRWAPFILCMTAQII